MPKRRLRGLLDPIVLLALVPAAFAPQAAAEPPEPGLASPPPASSRIADKPGEEEQIERRREWFLSSRRHGVGGVEEMAALRAKAVREVAASLAAQRDARRLGLAAQDNYWVAVGPAPSRFGGWAFGDVAGRITGIARDSAGRIYISSAAGGVWKTDNDGLSWVNVFENSGTQPTGAVAVDPNDDSVLWVGTGDFVTGCEGYFGIGLLRSTDGGATWESRNGSGASTLEDLSSFSSVVVDPRNSSHVVVGGTLRGCTSGQSLNGGLYTTFDGGLTWSKRIADTPVHEVAQDPTNRDVYWAATSQGVFKSTDNGQNWVKQTASGLPSSGTGRTELAIAPSNGNVVYVLFESSGFWRTTNGGSSWTQMSMPGQSCDGQCWYNMTLAVHRTNPDIVYRGTILIFKTVDGGAHWTQLTNGWGGSQQVHQDTHALLVDPSIPDKFYVGGDGGMWKSSNGGSTFVNMNGGLGLFLFYAVDSQENDPAVVCGGAQDNSSLVRTTGDVWDLQAVTGDGFVCAIDPQNPNYSYITSYPGSYPSVSRSTNGVLGSYSGITGAGSGISSGDRINWVTPYTLDPNAPATLLLGTHRVYRSTDHGSHWDPVGPADMTAGGVLNVVEFNRSDSRIVYAGSGDGKIWRSSDNGVNWTDISAGIASGLPVNDVAGDPEDPDRALSAVGGFNHAHLLEWTAARGTWVELGGGLPNVPANTVLMKTGSEVYVGTDVGVFKSVDGGATFAPFMNGLPQGLVVTDLKYSRTTSVLTAGTYGRGAYQVSVTPPGPIVMYDSIVLPMTEIDGDGDSNVEPGETWRVTPVLRNAGGQTALAVGARLATSTAGVTLLDSGVRSYGDLAPGASGAALSGIEFAVAPNFACGASIDFDVVDISSSNAPQHHKDRPAAFAVTVLDQYAPPIPSVLMDEDFDPNPVSGWTHEWIQVYQSACVLTRKDEWKYASKDVPHGSSFHCGQGPGGVYSTQNNAWLYYGGKDSTNGSGIVIPADAVAAQLTLVHWYAAQANADGGLVAVDATEDNSDTYTPIAPTSGYPGTLGSGWCNAQEGKQAFTGSSSGWITSTFDLSKYVGRRIYLAFVFASDKRTSTDEGWYLDRVTVDFQRRGAAICQVTPWAGLVPSTARFDLVAGSVQASWDASCSTGVTPDQTYSIQVGDLAGLRSTGLYSHAPVEARCDRSSPSLFAPGLGDEYYLVTANVAAREGSAGNRSDGLPRPQTSTVCGARHETPCP